MKVKQVINALLDYPMDADATVININDTRTEEQVDEANDNFVVAQVDGDEEQVRLYYAGRHVDLDEEEDAGV